MAVRQNQAVCKIKYAMLRIYLPHKPWNDELLPGKQVIRLGGNCRVLRILSALRQKQKRNLVVHEELVPPGCQKMVADCASDPL